MNITVSIALGPDDPTPTMTPAEMLVALGGDPDKDAIGVSVTAGHTPPPPPLTQAAPPPPTSP